MYKYIVNFIVCGFLGFKISRLVEKVIEYKEDKNKGKYEIKKMEMYWDRSVNTLVLLILSNLALFYYRPPYVFLILTLTFLGLLAIRIDERIRIIPNELVLAIFILGIIKQILTFGIKGLVSGTLGLLATSLLFVGSAYITRLLSGSIGVGAGDIKLAMAISFFLGISGIYKFWLGIVLFLAGFVILGLKNKTLKIGSSFPMAMQIIGGFILVLYEPIILELI